MQGFVVTADSKLERMHFETVTYLESQWAKLNKEKLWLLCDLQEIEDLAHLLQWNEASVVSCKAGQHRPLALIEEKYDFAKLMVSKQEGESFLEEALYIYISHQYLVVAKEDAASLQKEIASWLFKEKHEVYSLGYILFRVLDQVIQKDQVFLENLVEKVSKLEKCVIEEAPVSCIHEMIHLRKAVNGIKRHNEPVEDILTDLVAGSMGNEDGMRYFNILQYRSKRMAEHAQQLSEYITHIREAYDAQVDIKQNHIMKVFTIVTSVFLPLTLIAGWYGMNFATMPEINWQYGYLYVIVMSLLSSVLCLYCFKKKKWL